MSVINQVLNQLEKRGAHIAADQTMVRSVPPERGRINNKFVLLASGLVITGALLWQWSRTGKPDDAMSHHAQGINRIVAKVAAPVPGSVPMPGSVPVPGSVPLTGAAAMNTAAEIPPDLQLSFDLSSLELSFPLHMDETLPHPAATTEPLHDAKKHSSSTNKSSKNKHAESTSTGMSPVKKISKAQQADGEFRKAVALMRQGRIADAQAGYEAALRLDAGHDAARQALVALLLENKRNADAERVLQEGLHSKPEHTGFTMMLARLQVERGAVAEATATLETALPYANSLADYQAFLAALLQRQNRNDEAIAHYRVALQIAPNNGIWLMGYGISLQAAHRNTDAKVAYQRALVTRTLSPNLQAFVQQKIKGL